MLGFIAFIIKVVIGGVISYILPSLLKKDISHPDHLKISCIGILSTAIFSVSIQMDPGSSYVLSAGAMILIGFFSYNISNQMMDIEKILLFSCVVIGLFIGFGYILQGIILSFLVYYIVNNESDLFLFLNNNNNNDDESNNK